MDSSASLLTYTFSFTASQFILNFQNRIYIYIYIFCKVETMAFFSRLSCRDQKDAIQKNYTIFSFNTNDDTFCVVYSAYQSRFPCHVCQPRTPAFVSSCFFSFLRLNDSYFSFERPRNTFSVCSSDCPVVCGSSVSYSILLFHILGTHSHYTQVSAEAAYCVARHLFKDIFSAAGSRQLQVCMIRNGFSEAN